MKKNINILCLVGTVLLMLMSCEPQTRPEMGTIQISEETETSISCTCPLPSKKLQDYGFYYGKSVSDVTNDRSEKVAGIKDGDSFTAEITGLTHNTIYYIKAYAVNKKGIGYSEIVRAKTKSYVPGQDDIQYPEVMD